MKKNKLQRRLMLLLYDQACYVVVNDENSENGFDFDQFR